MTWVCTSCGSPDVYHDAYVGINDTKEVKIFDSTFCDRCVSECSITEASTWRIAMQPVDFDRPYVEFWNNETGWGSFVTATKFSEDETKTLNLPLDGTWVGS